MLDSSFLRESQSPTSRRRGNVERPTTKASSILQMWQEFEDDHVWNCWKMMVKRLKFVNYMSNRNWARERVSVRLRHQRSVESNTNRSSKNMSESRESEYPGSLEGASESDIEYGTWLHDQVGRQNGNMDQDNCSREQSPDLGEVDRERGRHIARGWMESGVNVHSSNVSQRNLTGARGELLGENDRERVRNVRQWVQMTSQQRGTRGGRGREASAVANQVEQIYEGSVGYQGGG